MTEKEVKQKLPVVLIPTLFPAKTSSIVTKISMIIKQKIATENGQMSIKGFEMKPLLPNSSLHKNTPIKQICSLLPPEK
jgi:hypothetical protein